MSPLAELLKDIAGAVARGRGTFGIVAASAADAVEGPLRAAFGYRSTFSLLVGARRTVKIPGGFLIALGLSREQLLALREECDAALQEGTKGQAPS